MRSAHLGGEKISLLHTNHESEQTPINHGAGRAAFQQIHDRKKEQREMKTYFGVALVAALASQANAACNEQAAFDCIATQEKITDMVECKDVQESFEKTVTCLKEADCDSFISTFCKNNQFDTAQCNDLTCAGMTRETLTCLKMTTQAIDEGVDKALTAIMVDGVSQCEYWKIRYKEALQFLNNERCLVDEAVAEVCEDAAQRATQFSCDFTCSKTSFQLTDPEGDAPSASSTVAASLFAAMLAKVLM